MSGTSPSSRGSCQVPAPPAAARSVRSFASPKTGFFVSGHESLLPLASRLTHSTPAEMYTSPSPALIAWKAIRVVCSDEEQYRLTVVPGRWSWPSSTATTRAMLKPCSPPGSPQPRIRSPTSAGSSCGTFARAALTICAARSSGRMLVSEPLPARPMGDRAVATITASGMVRPPRIGFIPKLAPARYQGYAGVVIRVGYRRAMQVHDSLSALVGNTPLVRLRSVTRGIPGATVLAKVEYFNPGGSVKDRIALRMVAAAEESGALRPGGTIVEPTSGNTGVGLAIVAAERGYRCVFVCPDKVAQDKIAVLRAYGAEVVVCPGTVAPDHPDSYYSVARRLAGEIPGGWQPDQYANQENPASHHATTGPEIWAQTDGTVTHFVAGIGTGGTITGTGRYLKEVSGGAVRVIGADPEGSVYSGGSGRPYLVEGVGEDIWPATYDPSVCDEIIAVSDAESFGMTRRLAREEALLTGGSSGLAVAAALRVAEGAGPDAVVVVLLPDGGRGYLSKIFNDEWMADYGFLSEQTTEPLVADVMARKGRSLPEFVHVHPEENVGAAIALLREYDVSQLPVVKEEPPVMAAEVIGSVVERDLLDALVAGRARPSDPVGGHMSAPLPTVGLGEPVSRAVLALEKAGAALVHVNGKPTGLLTRQDVLTFLAANT